MKHYLALLLVVASVYSPSFHGKIMANGDPYDHYAISCASRNIPIGSIVRLEYEGRSVTCEITDKTAKKYSGRIDLSGAAWKRLTGKKPGLVNAKMKIIKRG